MTIEITNCKAKGILTKEFTLNTDKNQGVFENISLYESHSIPSGGSIVWHRDLINRRIDGQDLWRFLNFSLSVCRNWSDIPPMLGGRAVSTTSGSSYTFERYVLREYVW